MAQRNDLGDDPNNKGDKKNGTRNFTFNLCFMYMLNNVRTILQIIQ